VIKDVRIVDGTGAPEFRGDVGLTGDRIAAVGKVEASDAPTIDGAGQVLAPGFVDIHTHYDPQLCWDRTASPTPEHGVSSLIIGNCSISLAPVRPSDTDRVVGLFGSVEDMESALLRSTIPFSWNSFGDYLSYMGKGLGPNVGALLGHSMLRMFVMGEAAQQRLATDDEIERMCEVLRQAVEAGAIGLSYSFSHLDEKGRMVPAMFSDTREREALTRTLGQVGRGVIEFTTGSGPERKRALIDEFAQYALDYGVNSYLSPLLQYPGSDDWRRDLEQIDGWWRRGAPLYAQTHTRPIDNTMALSKGSAVLGKQPTWRRILDLPMDQRIATLKDEAQRAILNEETDKVMWFVGSALVKRALSARNAPLVGRSVQSIAQETGQTFCDALIDIALADDLATEFNLDTGIHSDEPAVIELLHHPAVHMGAGDAGAHITQFAGAGDTTYLFERFVRELKAMTLERGVQRLTSELAQVWGLKDRGEIAVGKYADLVLFDPDTIGREPEVWVDDLPGGAGRYTRQAKGVRQVIVNGKPIVVDGTYTDQRPGRVV
jgi:N-acyl-D-aspartate/D-glutamate deacylase